MYITTKWRKIISIDEEPDRELIGANLVVNSEELLLINASLIDVKYNSDYSKEDRDLAHEMVERIRWCLHETE